MATNIPRDWRELFDVALFEPNRARLRKCIENAKHAIRNRLDALLPDALIAGALTNDKGENQRLISERIALTDALITLAELHKIVYAPKQDASIRREDARVAGQAGPQ